MISKDRVQNDITVSDDEATELLLADMGDLIPESRPTKQKTFKRPGLNSRGKRPAGAGHPEGSQNEITIQQLEFVQAYVGNGGNGKAAAITAGYSEKSAGAAAYNLLHNNAQVRKAIHVLRNEIARATAYDGVRAMGEAEQAMEFAIETGNANAFVKAVELRAKMHGLLIEKVDVRLAAGFQIHISGIERDPVAVALPEKIVEALESPKPPLPASIPAAATEITTSSHVITQAINEAHTHAVAQAVDADIQTAEDIVVDE